MASPRFAREQAAVDERLRAAGLPDYRSLMEQRMQEIEKRTPGRLELDVEAGNAAVPTAEHFRESLEHAVQIAQLNTEVNHPAEMP
jgi:hypothetical protein